MFIGDAMVRLFMRHGGDDAGLGIGPADHADALGGAQFGIAAIGGDRQRRLNRFAIAEMGGDAAACGFQPGHAGRRDQFQIGGHGGVKRGADMAVLGDMAQRRSAHFLGIKMQRERRGRAVGLAVGDQYLADRLGLGRQMRPDPQRRQHPDRGIGQCRDPAIEARIQHLAGARASTTTTLRPPWAAARPKVRPTMPPPQMMMSAFFMV